MSSGDTFRDLVDDVVLTSRLLPPGWRLITRDGLGVIAETDVQAPIMSWTELERLWLESQ
jgi:hypothetical protein